MTKNTNHARRSPDFLKDSVVYQIFLRPFTVDGTLQAASRLLPHLAEMGVDIVYLCPICLQDDDMRTEFWSDRQNKSGLGNPRNPYRIKDYFALDPEYGTEQDLHDFVQQTHALGMKILLDLVYYHCGPTAVFLDEHPDFVRRDASGNVLGSWHFPELNFDVPALREHLWENMEYFMKEFHVDGYRCDVGPRVPIDFWEEGRRRMEAIDPDCIMICEGDVPHDQLFAFDLNYAFSWEYGLIRLFNKEKTAVELREIWQKMHDEFPVGARFLRMFENHDIAHDCAGNRHQTRWGNPGVEAALLVNFAIDGVPLLYNGQEIADAAQHSIYGNRDFGKRLMIDWSNAAMEEGRNRLRFVRRLIELRRSSPALTAGTVRWLENDQPENVVSFARECAGQRMLLVVNADSQPKTVAVEVGMRLVKPKSILQYGADVATDDGKLRLNLLPYGYALLQY